VHRIVGRIRPRPRAAIHRIAAHPLNPDGCARPTAGPLNTPRPAGIGAAGLGAGKIATLAAVATSVIGSTPIPHDGPPPPSPIIVPPPPVPVCTVNCGIVTPPVNVPEPATVAIFAMALAAMFLVRSITGRRARTA